MKREILFRSWNEKENKFYLFFNGLVYSSMQEIEIFKHIGGNNFHKFNWDNAEQFTGLTDKNGVKIFEGDVLRHNIQGDRIVYYPFNDTSATFGLSCVILGHRSYLHNSNIYEVIGNIYE